MRIEISINENRFIVLDKNCTHFRNFKKGFDLFSSKSIFTLHIYNVLYCIESIIFVNGNYNRSI